MREQGIGDLKKKRRDENENVWRIVTGGVWTSIVEVYYAITGDNNRGRGRRRKGGAEARNNDAACSKVGQSWPNGQVV